MMSMEVDDTTTDVAATKNLFMRWQQECILAAASASPQNTTTAKKKNRHSKLYKEASSFFASIITSSSSSNHEQALALLIQSLQPAFSSSIGNNNNSDNNNNINSQHNMIYSHLAALECLQGALQACHGIGLSLALVDLLGTFLLQQIGPLNFSNDKDNEHMHILDNDNDINDNVDIDALEQQVRDTSLETMSLLQQSMTNNTTADTAAAAAAAAAASTTTTTTTGSKQPLSAISLTCRLAQSAVQRRCAEKQYDNDDDDDDNNKTFLSLLPRSKRSLCFDVLRVAVDCLNNIILYYSNNNNNNNNNDYANDDDDEAMHNFALYCIASLVGESDPRCLLQLLQLLSALQEACCCYPVAAAKRSSATSTKRTKANSSSSSFLIIPLFNAVAPYYPIQFTPPPNNIHGITKQALQQALWNVLSCTKNDDEQHNNHDHSSSSMFSLTLGIVLERLVPLEPDDPLSTPEEQMEALDDLTRLLHLSSSSSSGSENNDTDSTATTVMATATRGGAASSSSSSSRLDYMDAAAMQQLSDTLRTVHDRASLVVAKAARGGGEATASSYAARVNKQVADTCRTLVGRIALECETKHGKKKNSQQHWQIFVANLVQNQLAPKLLVLGDYGSRAAIAYMACLAGCGGIKTLRLVLQCGLDPLINVVVANYPSSSTTITMTSVDQEKVTAPPSNNNNNKKDDASIAIAISGIAAFLVSTQVTLSKMQQQGIVLTPHPLQPHATRMLNVFSNIILNDNDNNNDHAANDDIRIAAVRAVEVVLLTVPALVLFDAVQANSGETTTMETIVQLIQVMTDAVVIVNAGGKTRDDDNNNDTTFSINEEWPKACAETLGRVLGKVLQDGNQSNDEDDNDSGDLYVGILQDNHAIRGYLLDSVLTALLTSASVPRKTTTTSIRYRYDHMTLAMAASSKSSAAVRILEPLLQELCTLIQNQKQEKEASVCVQREAACAQTIASILSNWGGASAALAFQQESMTTILLDMIKALAKQATMATGEQGGVEAAFRMSKLTLPPTEEDESHIFELLQKGRDLLLPMLSAYSFATVTSHRERLGTAVAEVLPPLSASDTVRLSLTLPFLATALQQDDSSVKLPETENATLSTIVADLADFALYGNGSSAPSRSFAAVCLHSILVRMDSVTACPCFELMKKVVMPLILSTILQVSRSTGAKDTHDLIVKCKESLSFVGLLGSAAACRGGSSAKTADKIASFLIDLACYRVTNDTFFNNNNTPCTIDLTVFDKRQKGASTDLEVGAASAFGSILSCGVADSLWKQRMCVIGYNQLHGNMADEVLKPSIGAVCVSSYLICSTGNLSSLPSKNGSPAELLTKIILDSLSSPTGMDATPAIPQCILPTLVKKLVLTAIIKMLCVAPTSMTPNLYFIVVGVMRAYASHVPDDSYSSPCVVEQDDTVCKVLALQALETIATVPGAPKDLLGAVKPAVVAILGAAMNEKSSVLRQAAVEVRNAWFVIPTASTTGSGAYSFGTTALAGAAQAM